eukprot:8936052-Alexandrium_andersonii.AAC.1
MPQPPHTPKPRDKLTHHRPLRRPPYPPAETRPRAPRQARRDPAGQLWRDRSRGARGHSQKQ